jgi:hypothetical protein
MAVQMHSIQWVVECTLRQAGAPKMRLAKDGTFTDLREKDKTFGSYTEADRARRGLRTPTQIVES